MATIQSQLVCDSSTYANYSQWASAISAAFASFGWVQSTDTGQVMWTGLSISAATKSGSNVTYTYSGLTGLALAVGRALTITGMVNAGNNGTFVITGLATGTFTVVNVSGVTETGSAGVVTAQATVPGSAAYFYEIWTPNDGLPNFYVKTEYGNNGGTNSPGLRITVSTGTNGTGTPNGYVMGPWQLCTNVFVPPSTTTQYECNFSGAAGRMAVMMWRNSPTTTACQFFGIERSINSAGVYTGTHVTVLLAGYNNSFARGCTQGTLMFGVGVAPNNYNVGSDGQSGWAVRGQYPFGGGSSAFNGSLPLDFPAPCVGYFDYPLTIAGAGWINDFVEAVTFQTTVYGSSRMYLPSKAGAFAYVGRMNNNGALAALCMRFD